MQPTNALRTHAKYISLRDLCKVLYDVRSCGQVDFVRLDAVPETAIERSEQSIFFFDTDCGADHALLGADELYQMPDSEVVVAIVAQNARLIPADDTATIKLESGVWAFVNKTAGNRQLHSAMVCLIVGGIQRG